MIGRVSVKTGLAATGMAKRLDKGHVITGNIQVIGFIKLANAGWASNIDFSEVVADDINADKIQAARFQGRTDLIADPPITVCQRDVQPPRRQRPRLPRDSPIAGILARA